MKNPVATSAIAGPDGQVEGAVAGLQIRSFRPCEFANRFFLSLMWQLGVEPVYGVAETLFEDYLNEIVALGAEDAKRNITDI